MKKYRLIENAPKVTHEVNVYNSEKSAVTAMLGKMIANPNCFYRIEEVEESIMDRVKSYEDACEVLDESPRLRTDLPDHIETLLKLETITAALNEGWKPDCEDVLQDKFYIYYSEDYKGLSTNKCCATSVTTSRLYFKSRELAEYAAKQFAELYTLLLTEKF